MILVSFRPLNAQTPAMDALKTKFQQGEVFQAEFEHFFYDSFTQDTTRYSGKIWIGTNRYKVQTSNRTLLVVDSLSRVYDEVENRLIISHYDPEEDDFAPARFLTRPASQYEASQSSENGSITISFNSTDAFSYFKKISLHLSQSNIPQSVTAVDQTDNVLKTEFGDSRFINTREQEIFELNYPENAELIDLRKEE